MKMNTKNSTRLAAILLSTMLATNAVCKTPKNIEEFTDLTIKVGEVQIGMHKNQVLAILGDPNWAVLRADKGEFAITSQDVMLALYWRNEPCTPAAINFDRKNLVNGINEGRAWCDPEKSQIFNLGDEYLCKGQRIKHCQQGSSSISKLVMNGYDVFKQPINKSQNIFKTWPFKANSVTLLCVKKELAIMVNFDGKSYPVNGNAIDLMQSDRSASMAALQSNGIGGTAPPNEAIEYALDNLCN